MPTTIPTSKRINSEQRNVANAGIKSISEIVKHLLVIRINILVRRAIRVLTNKTSSTEQHYVVDSIL